MTYLVDFLAGAAFVYLAWTICDHLAYWYHAHVARRKRDRYWRDMEQRIEFWQKYDREFSSKQKRIREGK